MKIEKRPVGNTRENKGIYQYSLENDHGVKVSILNLGAVIYEILTPDRRGKFENIVLSLDQIQDYEDNPKCLGCIVGRTAGRISKGEFSIDGKKYNLAKNKGNHNIHGGIRGFGKVIWNVEEIADDEVAALQLSYTSPHMEEGFPGNLKMTVTYELNNSNELRLTYRGISDHKTIVNLTNHSYFNLSGNAKRDILEHTLTINAGQIAVIDGETLPTGEIMDVEGTIFDFRASKKVGRDINDQILAAHRGYDHPYILDSGAKPAIVLEDEISGRRMEVETDRPTVVFYTGNYLNEELILKGGIKGRKHYGLCLETQDFPDAPNHSHFPSIVIDEGQEYIASTVFRFK